MKYLQKKTTLAVFIFLLYGIVYAQDDNTDAIDSKKIDPFGTEFWLEDNTTIVFGWPNEREGLLKHALNGLRIIYEPQFGFIVQNDDDNKFVVEQFTKLSKFGVETNLVKSYVALQAGVVFPSSVEFDDKSTVVTGGYLKNSAKEISVDYGLSFGFSFFDGMISIGFGKVVYDQRDFDNSIDGFKEEWGKSNFTYFNIQPVSALKSLLKRVKKE